MINNSTTTQQSRGFCLRIHYDQKQMLHFAKRCFFYKYIELKTVSISYHNFKTCCRLMRVLFIILIPKKRRFLIAWNNLDDPHPFQIVSLPLACFLLFWVLPPIHFDPGKRYIVIIIWWWRMIYNLGYLTILI